MMPSADAGAGRFELPPPGPDALARSARLAADIARRIAADGGVIGFDDYLQMALYRPGLGYYAADAAQFGAAGDFVTAPEISPLFGHCLARQVGELAALGCRPAVLEFGAGSGRLCADLMGAMPGIESYSILEVSGALRQRQQELLRARLDPAAFARIEWLERLPDAFRGVVIANEVLDAMPFRLLRKRGDWVELGVAAQGGALCWRERAPDARLRAAIAAIEAEVGELPDGYRTEVNLLLPGWFAALAEACAEAALLVIDYGFERPGYYRVERARGTLNCHYRHRVHDDPLLYPGLQDITASVDFDACADAALDAGFVLHGLLAQRDFLIANGLLDIAADWQRAADATRQFAIAQQVKTLSLPEEMGSRFRVLGASRGLDFEWPAFAAGRARG